MGSSKSDVRFAPVILAGGSGTRFWPRSRKAKAKQVLALDGQRTMIQQTLDRLLPLADASDVWVITNDLLDDVIGEQLPEVPRERILSEPAARNTAPACALAAFLLERTAPETVIGIFPSDHAIKDTARFAEVVRAGVALAASGDKVVVLGVPPARAETGYGYIELGGVVDDPAVADSGIEVRRVKRFTEKPDRARAEEFVASGNYAWNGGIFLWSARTLAGAIREFRPAMAPLLEKIAAAYGTAEFERVFAEEYPQCENISIDYAVLEPRSAKGEMNSGIYCLPGDFAWNDLGCWSALHEHVAACPPDMVSIANVIDGQDPLTISIDSCGNYVYAPGKVIALVGVSDLVVVQTGDALLITTRERSQDVGKVVAELKTKGREDLI
ncbi:mannose-1-phosphate guanylyltransferase (GDP) /mannose-6-phosphate isomerase type 2 [Edaphobacter aggregans]|uniref:Mannose-1-phosphate guanylyltransferase (GDP) /mannose-6-phosphate isomerase type 2 n=2 Tax=Edaphobacter aggregans TaxID=570835 RepID=A0A3R9Q9Z5_9BACT|nr:mannose-1-phosphate guanylyltransferase (GDP) /mannose-6-phosphate isomerase type 2 [Edaphobacter aggregans]